MRKIVGYFEGTDSTLLTGLVCDGHDTVPISNGFDNHGMHVRIINNENKVDLLIGYVHKIFAPEDSVQPGGVTYEDIFHVCRTFDIPLLLEVRSDRQQAARESVQRDSRRRRVRRSRRDLREGSRDPRVGLKALRQSRIRRRKGMPLAPKRMDCAQSRWQPSRHRHEGTPRRALARHSHGSRLLR